MNLETGDRDELERLLDRWCDGCITAEEGDRLDALLRKGLEARRYFLEFVQLDAQLRWEWGERVPEAEAASAERAIREKEDEGKTDRPSPPSRPLPIAPSGGSGRARRIVWLSSGLAAAAATILWLGGRGWFDGRPPAAPPAPSTAVASIQSAENDVAVLSPDGRSRRAISRTAVVAGDTVRTGPEDGQARLTYGDSTVLDLGPGTALDFTPKTAESADVLTQRTGSLTLKVGQRPSDRPLVLRTPHGEIRVTGTRFTSLVGPSATRVEIEEGNVRVTRLSDGQAIGIREGDYTLIGAGAEPLVPRTSPIVLTEAARMLDASPYQFILALALTGDGATLIAGNAKGPVAFWDLATGRVRRVLDSHMDGLRCLALSPDGRLLAVGDLHGRVQLWDVATGKPAAPTIGQSTYTSAVAFCDGGALLAATARVRGPQSVVRLWRTETGQHEADLPWDASVLRSLAVSPDGRTLAGGDDEGDVAVWDVRHHRLQGRISAHGDGVPSIGFSPDGRWLATGCRDGTVRLWDATTRELRGTLKGHTTVVLSLAFCQDRMLLATIDQHGITRLWDLRTMREVVGFLRVKWRESRIAFMPDGRVLVATGGKEQIRLWDVPEEVRESSGAWGGR
jgi:WD40 repeat protein